MKYLGKLDVPNVNHTDKDYPKIGRQRFTIGMRRIGNGKVRIVKGEQILFQGTRQALKVWLAEQQQLRNKLEGKI